MSESGFSMENQMSEALRERRAKGNLRKLTPNATAIDFSSNDYLGLAHDKDQEDFVDRRYEAVRESFPVVLGSTGSRLLSGDSPYFHQVEKYLAAVHEQDSALICNSGYDANLSVISTLTTDCVIYDEYIHNSLHMGLRLWMTRDGEKKEAYSFKHNDVQSMREKFERIRSRNVVVVVESVYSMDGDVAPLKDILGVAHEFAARVIVDEAHGLGVFGNGAGVLQREGLARHPALLCSINTFGKAAGCHGAVVCGSSVLREYLINFAYPVIYSTSLPLHSLVAIQCSYESMTGERGTKKRTKVFGMVTSFHRQMIQLLDRMKSTSGVRLLPSETPIQALIIPGNERCVEFCEKLFSRSQGRIRLFPIKSPTVPRGQERVRIILHAHNSKEEVDELIVYIQDCLQGLANRSRL